MSMRNSIRCCFAFSVLSCSHGTTSPPVEIDAAVSHTDLGARLDGGLEQEGDATNDGMSRDEGAPSDGGPFKTCAMSTGNTGGDRGNGIVVDSLGNAYVTGCFSGTVSFGATTLISKGQEDVFVAKFDPDCGVLWAVSTGGSAIDEGKDIALDSAGNVYVTGEFHGEVSFGATLLAPQNLSSSNVFVAKLDPAGKFVWAVGGGGKLAEKIGVDASGNAYIAGSFNGDDVAFGATKLKSNGGWDVFVAKVPAGGGDLQLGDRSRGALR
jgi:hypothetical protein